MLKTFHRSLLTLAALAALAGCDGNSSNAVDVFTLQGCADSGTCASNPPLLLGGDRPAMAQIPSDYDNNRRYPLIVLLHGRGVTGEIQALYMSLFERIDRQQFVLVYPDGLVAADGRRQWRFTPTCCDTPAEEANNISDVGYLSALIREAAATYSIDTTRVGLIGHSSGGFMSLTMACEASHLVTSLVNLAGSTFVDLDLCRPVSKPVSVLGIHGDRDDTVFFEGREGVYLGAPQSAERYAMLAGCNTGNPVSRPAIDLVANLEGAETSRTAWQGCRQGTEVEFWRINDGPHIPGPWVSDGLDAMVDWVLQHPR